MIQANIPALLERVTDEALVRQFRFIRGPWWGLRPRVIIETLALLETELKRRSIDPDALYWDWLCDR
jgi:hypothetical protein